MTASPEFVADRQQSAARRKNRTLPYCAAGLRKKTAEVIAAGDRNAPASLATPSAARTTLRSPLRRGANPSLKDGRGRTPLQMPNRPDRATRSPGSPSDIPSWREACSERSSRPAWRRTRRTFAGTNRFSTRSAEPSVATSSWSWNGRTPAERRHRSGAAQAGGTHGVLPDRARRNHPAELRGSRGCPRPGFVRRSGRRRYRVWDAADDAESLTAPPDHPDLETYRLPVRCATSGVFRIREQAAYLAVAGAEASMVARREFMADPAAERFGAETGDRLKSALDAVVDHEEPLDAEVRIKASRSAQQLCSRFGVRHRDPGSGAGDLRWRRRFAPVREQDIVD